MTQNYANWLPEHRGKEFVGRLAYVDGQQEARDAALAEGWYLVHVDDEIFHVETPNDFQPGIYRAPLSPPHIHHCPGHLPMRLTIFLSGLLVLALGVTASRLMEKPAAYGFLTESLTLGGALVICSLFALRNRWHGIIGAGVIALLGASRGIENIAALPAVLLGNSAPVTVSLLGPAIALICIGLLVIVVRALFAEKTRRLVAGDTQD